MKKNILIPFMVFSLAFTACQKQLDAPANDGSITAETSNELSVAGTTVLYGSSTIAQWPIITNPFMPYKTVKLGYGGKTYAFFAANTGIITQYKPTNVVIYSGDNDIVGGRSQWAIQQDICRTILRIEAANPGVKIQWLYIKYGKATMYRKSVITYLNRNTRNWINGTYTITGYPRPKNAVAIDIASPLLKPDGSLNPYYYKAEDMLHLKAVAYTEILNPRVSAVLQ